MRAAKSPHYLLFYYAIAYYQQSLAGCPQGITSRRMSSGEDDDDELKMILKAEGDGVD
jgi:hypothetical protein